MAQNEKSGYRPDIDGLRAVAVLGVVLFHLNGAWLPGGFIGVDVFFVISGFLISSHIFSSVQAGTFSFKDFYRRRINRILPALYGVILFMVAVCSLFYLPPDFKKAAQSAVEALSFKANYYFAGDYDYFAPSTSELPLLNLWSLSVEEQFYLFLPAFVLLGLSRLQLHKRKFVILSLILGSLAFAEYRLSHGAVKMAYYSVLTRASELLIGTLLACFAKGFKNKALAEIAGAVGLAMLIWSFFYISSSAPFPGLMSLPPCLGTALIIFSGQKSPSFISKVLCLPPLVFVGLISYSLYLYHWPVMAVARYIRAENNFPPTVMILVTVISFVLAVMSWRFIETPFRKNSPAVNKVFLQRFLLPSLLGIGLLVIITKTRGLPQRYGSHADHVTNSILFLSHQYCHMHFEDGGCKFGDLQTKPKILLLGDSTAGHYQPVLNEIGKKLGFSFIARSWDSCYPLVKVINGPLKLQTSSECIRQIEWSEQAVAPFEIVILSDLWSRDLKMPVHSEYIPYLEKSVKNLVARHKKVIFMEQIPECHGMIKFYRQKFSLLSFLFDSGEQYKQIAASCGDESKKANQFMEDLAARTGATFLKASSMYLRDQTLPFSGEDYLYRDDTHLNEFGAIMVGKYLAEKFPELKREFVKDSRAHL